MTKGHGLIVRGRGCAHDELIWLAYSIQNRMESMQLKSVEHDKVSKAAHEEDHKKTNMTNQSRQVMGLVEEGCMI